MSEQLLLRLTKLLSGAVLFCQPHQQLLTHSFDKALVFAILTHSFDKALMFAMLTNSFDKALVSVIFFVCRRVAEYVSLELFCFVLQELQSKCESFRKVKLSLLELKGHV